MSCHLSWLEIDLSVIAGNVRSLKGLIGRNCRLMAVIKADGYGHGMRRVAEIALKNGASMLGVARVEEGVDLRTYGLDAPILVMGYTPPGLIREIIDYNLIQTVWSADEARLLSQSALAKNTVARVHFKVDTGMGRLGKNLLTEDARTGLTAAVREAVAIADQPGLLLEGVYTHFAAADDPDKTYTRTQTALFEQLTAQLASAGLSGLIRHAANSAALIDFPETHLDMVRPGIALYGLYPSVTVDRQRVSLQPAMTWKTRIVQLKKVPAGTKISYGSTYTAPKSTTLAVVPVGYADGYNRRLSSRGHMLVSGQKAPVVGRVCMDLTVLDVGGIDPVAVEDEVVVLGRQGQRQISAEEIAAALDTIHYEVVSAITHRVSRVFV